MSDLRNCFNFMQKHFLNYHCVGASLTFLCHLYCKSSHPYGAFLTFWEKKKSTFVLFQFFSRFLCCQRLFLMFLTLGSLNKPGLWILHVVVCLWCLGNVLFIHWGTWNRVSSVSVSEGSWLAVGSLIIVI